MSIKFKDTNEYLYLQTLSSSFDELVKLKDNLSDQDFSLVIPILNKINDALNKER